MCGIAGVSHMTDVTRRLIPHLLWDIESRGHDSWGATSGKSTYKHLGPITSSFSLGEKRVFDWDRAIFHTRSASTGDVTIDNQHPFEFDRWDKDDETWKYTVVGIHNGIVANHDSLCMKYSRKFEVDSMHIFANMAEQKPLSEIHGWGNLAWYEFDEQYPDGVLRLLRFNNDALHIALLGTGEYAFCSTKDTLLRAAFMAGTFVKKFFPTEEETVYTVRKDDTGEWVLFRQHAKLRFGSRSIPNPPNYHEYRSVRPNTFDGFPEMRGRRLSAGAPTFANIGEKDRCNGICGAKNCGTEVHGTRKSALVCDKHLVEAGAGLGV